MRLLLNHPKDAGRSCEECAKYVTAPDRSFVRVGGPRGQRRQERSPGAALPCHGCPKIPDDAPAKVREHAVEFGEQGWAAYWHYLECKAVGQFPADPIVRRVAAIFRLVEDGQARAELVGRADQLITGLSLLGRR